MKYVVKKIENRHDRNEKYISWDVYLYTQSRDGSGHEFICECARKHRANEIRDLLNKEIGK